MRRALAVCGLLGVAGLPGCMGGSGESALEGNRIPRATQLVQCRDWNEADPRARDGTIDALREFAGGPTGSPAGTGQTLEDDEAYRLFDNWCERDYAEGFRLYKLYTRAAAFKSAVE